MDQSKLVQIQNNPCKQKMNLGHLVLVFLSCSVACYCAAVENAENAADASSVAVTHLSSKKNPFLDFPEELCHYISEFLEFPRIQLCNLDHHLRIMFTITFPYNKVLASRHGIVELEKVTSVKDLLVLNQLRFIKDEKHLYRSLYSLLFEKNAFPENGASILKYLIRTKDVWPEGLLKHLDRECKKIITKSADYGFMIECVVKKICSLHESFFKCLDMKIGKEFMTHVMNIDEELYRKIENDLGVDKMESFNQEQARKNVYNHLSRFVDIVSFVEFIFMSLLANVPEKYYIQSTMSYYHGRFSVVKQIIWMKFVVTNEENLRIQNLINLLMKQMDKKDVQRSKLMNNIRYGSVDTVSLINELKFLNWTPYILYEVVAVALRAKNYEALIQIRKNCSVEIWNDIIEHTLSNYLFYALLEIYTEREKQELFYQSTSLDFLMNNYDLDYFEFNEDASRTIFHLILRPEFSDSGLPTIFDFSLILNQNNIKDLKIFKKSFFNQHTMRDVESVHRLLFSYIDFVSRGYSIIGVLALPASNSILKTISGSEILLNMTKELNLKFTVDDENSADLLENDISHLRGTISDFPTYRALHRITSVKQVRNLEKFLEADIGRIFYRHIPERGSEHYYKLRTVLRYWVKSQSKGSMFELKANHSIFLDLLLNEVDIEDANFIQSLLNRQN